MTNYSNAQLRRFIRKYAKVYPGTSTRDITRTFGRVFACPRQRIAGNLRTMVYDRQITNRINTVVPRRESFLQNIQY